MVFIVHDNASALTCSGRRLYHWGMCVTALSNDGQDGCLESQVAGLPGPDVDAGPAAGATGRPGRLLRAEANLLRLPVFALHTKGLRSLDGIECSGRIARDGHTYRFTFRSTRNTATAYPGPLARSAHLAFLSLLTERGLPSPDPLTWTWRELCRRMGVTYGGQMVRHLKEAITATTGLLLHSEFALYSKPEGRLLQTGQEALHLYERVAFVGSPLPEGGTADRNYLWLSDWYRENLDSLFSAPLDYHLWRDLDARSPLASRLYEFLLLNFHGPAPVLRINYETLVQFLPARAERYRSLAERQLGPALELLTQAGILDRADWTEGKGGLTQVQLHRGRLLAPPQGRSSAVLPLEEDEGEQPVEVKELRNVRPPEWGLISDFYRLWIGQERRPTVKELDQARGLIARHGPAKAKGLIPLLVKRMKSAWPDAKTFGATAAYIPEAARDYDREQQRRKGEREERRQEQRDQGEQQDRKREREELRRRWKPVWKALPEEEQAKIRREMGTRWPHEARIPVLLERRCLEELSRRRTAIA